MRLRTLAAAASLAVLLPGLATTPAHAADPAQRAARVTMKNLPASSEVGRKVTIAGTARLARKGKRVKVTVERSYGGGRWQKVATTRTSKKGKYAAKVTLSRGGPTSFRVKRAGGGTSGADSLAVLAWLDLVDQPQVAGGNLLQLHRTSVIGGRAFPQSYEAAGSDSLLIAKPSRLCTAVEVWSGFLDGQRSGLPASARQKLTFQGLAAAGANPVTLEAETPVGPAVRRTFALSGQTYLFLNTSVTGLPDDFPTRPDAVTGSPRLRCNAARLPAFSVNELAG